MYRAWNEHGMVEMMVEDLSLPAFVWAMLDSKGFWIVIFFCKNVMFRKDEAERERRGEGDKERVEASEARTWKKSEAFRKEAWQIPNNSGSYVWRVWRLSFDMFRRRWQRPQIWEEEIRSSLIWLAVTSGKTREVSLFGFGSDSHLPYSGMKKSGEWQFCHSPDEGAQGTRPPPLTTQSRSETREWMSPFRLFRNTWSINASTILLLPGYRIDPSRQACGHPGKKLYACPGRPWSRPRTGGWVLVSKFHITLRPFPRVMGMR